MSDEDTDWGDVFGSAASMRIAGWIWFLVIIPIIVFAVWVFFGHGFEMMNQ
jgi:uncharacterized protein HemY